MSRRIASPQTRIVLPLAVLALLTLFLFDTAVAAAAPAAKTGKKRAKKSTAAIRQPVPAKAVAGAAGMKAYIDPVTGKLTRPAVDDTRPAEKLGIVRATADDNPIPVLQLGNGTEMARLDDRYQDFEVARIGPDGKLVRDCVQGKDGIAKFQKAAAGTAQPAPAREVK